MNAMKAFRIGCACLLLALALPFAALAEDEPALPIDYVLGIEGPEKTHASSGTGGAESRFYQPAFYGDRYQYGYGDQWRGRGYDLYGVNISRGEVSDWVRAAIGAANFPEERRSVTEELHGGLLSVNVRGTDATETFRSYWAVFDLEGHRRLALSDLFYDGFNYIEYINDTILTLNYDAIAEDPLTWEVEYLNDSLALSENLLKRPFTGLPNDYPNFSVVYSWRHGTLLRLHIPDSNPFWNGGISLPIPLSHEVSPYAGCRVDVELYRRQATEELAYALPVLRIDQGAHPEVEAAINAAVARMGKEVRRRPEMISLRGERLLESEVMQWGRWVGVHFPTPERDYWETTYEGHRPVVTGAVFDAHTGEQVVLAEDLPYRLGFYGAGMTPDVTMCYEDPDTGELTPTLLWRHDPALAEATFLDMWLVKESFRYDSVDQIYVVIRARMADGRVLRVQRLAESVLVFGPEEETW